MKLFMPRQIREAYKWVQESPFNSALHLHFFVFPNSPSVFKKAVARREPIAHLFSQDKEFLIEVAKYLGVNKIVIDREGTFRQHVDLCGNPLADCLSEMGYNLGDFLLGSPNLDLDHNKGT